MKPVIGNPEQAETERMNRLFPGDAPSSPNAPENIAAAEAAALAETNRIAAERYAREQAVRNGTADGQ